MYGDKLPIQDPAKWIEQTYGPLYEQTDRATIEDYPLLSMSFFPGERDHCSLVALTSVFRLYAGRGYHYLPADIEKLFYRIRRLARLRLISFARGPLWKGGTLPFALPALARAVWHFYGYRRGRAKNGTYLFSGRRAAADVKASLDEGRPVILSLSSGYYRKHTVTIYGYEIWERRPEAEASGRVEDLPQQFFFLRLNDHWSLSPRFLELNTLDPAFGGPFFLLTFIQPPLLEDE